MTELVVPEVKRPELDPQTVEDVYEDLGRLDVTLDADPLIYGPKRLNGKVAALRDMLSRCEALFLQVSQDRHRFQRAHRVASVALDLAKKRLYDKDPEVRAGRSVADRDAIATGKLATAVDEANRLELAVNDLDALLVVIKAKRADLRDAEGRLRDQIRLCSEEIGLGSRWGSQLPNAPELEPGQGRATGADIKAVEDLLANLDGETHLPPLGDDSEEEEDASPDKPSVLVAEERPSLGRVFEKMKPPLQLIEVKPETVLSPEVLISPPTVALPSSPEPTVQVPWSLDPDSDEDEEEPTFEPSSNGGSFPSVEALNTKFSSSASPEAVDNFLTNLQGEKGKDGKTRIEPLDDEVLDNLLDSFL